MSLLGPVLAIHEWYMYHILRAALSAGPHHGTRACLHYAREYTDVGRSRRGFCVMITVAIRHPQSLEGEHAGKQLPTKPSAHAAPRAIAEPFADTPADTPN